MSSRNRMYNPRIGDDASPLAVVGLFFNRLAATPVEPMAEGLVGLPESVSSWGELRTVLMDPELPIETVDAVWVWLITRARTGGQDAVLSAAAMAVPMMATMADRFASSLEGYERLDAEADVLTGFLAALPQIDLDSPYVWFRLRWATYRGGAHGARRVGSAPIPVEELSDPAVEDARVERGLLPKTQEGHPEMVLVEAVDAGVITAAEAELIASTRLKSRTLGEVAAELGQKFYTVQKRRRRAELRLRSWLTAQDEMDPTRTSSTESQALALVSAPSRRGAVAGVEGHRQVSDRGSVSKNSEKSGSDRCGRISAAPAQPDSAEVNRRCA